ncbi:MAG: ACP S-malonyltransferase [Clostridium sp.]
MANIGFVFSGQGSQYVGMGKDLYENYTEAKEVFDKADNILGYSIKDICFNGPKDKLDITNITQPAIFTLSVAIANILKNKNINAMCTCGLSLGEYTGIYYAGMINLEEGLKLLKLRGEIMSRAYPTGKGAMTAVIGLKKEDVEDSIKLVENDGIVEIANLNCPGQIVVTGDIKAIENIEEVFKSKKAMKVVRLDVSGPFHSSLLKEASLELRLELEKLKFKNNELPVLTNYTGDVLDKNEIVNILSGQMCSTVYFEDNIRKMLELGVDTFIEIGPGKALSGFIKRIDRKVKIMNAEDMESLKTVLEYFHV